MRIESTVTSISWIPSEAIPGPMRLPMDIGVGHYDKAPPEKVDDVILDQLRESDALRFANKLQAWVDVRNGAIVAAGYSGRALVGSTTVRLGLGSVTFPGIAYPLMQAKPAIENGVARFEQTAGGRTGAPFPRRISHPPYLRITGPAAWTTLALEISAHGTVRHEVVGASPFPRHWIYDGEGVLAAKSGVIDWSTWTKEYDHVRSPWNDVNRGALIAGVETEFERTASRDVMTSKPRIRKLSTGAVLTLQGEPGDELYLVLDGVFEVEVDGKIIAEIGPGAVVGERAVLEEGLRTSTVRALTPTKVAAVSADTVAAESLADIAAGHRREEV